MSRATKYPTIVWLQRHRTLARIFDHGPLRNWMSRRVWAELDADPTFREEVAQGKADYAAGRFYTMDTATHETIPNPDWPKDGPQPRDYDP